MLATLLLTAFVSILLNNNNVSDTAVCDPATVRKALHHHSSSSCPSNMIDSLQCTEWLVDSFDSILIPHGSVVAAGANSTELKLCESNIVPTTIRSAGFKLASGIALVKCNRALVEVRHHPPRGRITCGAGHGGVVANKVHESVDFLLATDINFGNSVQHDIQNGLGMASVMWNYIHKTPNLQILTGKTLAQFWADLVGNKSSVNIIRGSRESWWFRSLYLGAVPEAITFTDQNEIPAKATGMAERIQYGVEPRDPMLPCSVRLMLGFQEWMTSYAPSSSDYQNGTLLYLQRAHRRYYSVWDCHNGASNSSCSCQSVSDSEFVGRLQQLSQLHGLQFEVFDHTTMKKDAATFSEARIVLGPHGGAFSNIIFLNPELDPLIIETNLQQAIYDQRLHSHHHWNEPPRPFYTHLAESLGHR